MGGVFQDNENTANGNAVSPGLHLSGQFGNDTRVDYCSFTVSSANRDWPQGSYCMPRYSSACPSGFSTGFIFWDDEDEANSNSISGPGVVPSGKFGCSTLVDYCCRSDGAIATPIVLPTATPFYLLQQSVDGCQQVAGANVTREWVFTDDENDNNENRRSGSVPFVEGTFNYRLYYCYYIRT